MPACVVRRAPLSAGCDHEGGVPRLTLRVKLRRRLTRHTHTWSPVLAPPPCFSPPPSERGRGVQHLGDGAATICSPGLGTPRRNSIAVAYCEVHRRTGDGKHNHRMEEPAQFGRAIRMASHECPSIAGAPAGWDNGCRANPLTLDEDTGSGHIRSAMHTRHRPKLPAVPPTIALRPRVASRRHVTPGPRAGQVPESLRRVRVATTKSRDRPISASTSRVFAK